MNSIIKTSIKMINNYVEAEKAKQSAAMDALEKLGWEYCPSYSQHYKYVKGVYTQLTLNGIHSDEENKLAEVLYGDEEIGLERCLNYQRNIIIEDDGITVYQTPLLVDHKHHRHSHELIELVEFAKGLGQ